MSRHKHHTEVRFTLPHICTLQAHGGASQPPQPFRKRWNRAAPHCQHSKHPKVPVETLHDYLDPEKSSSQPLSHPRWKPSCPHQRQPSPLPFFCQSTVVHALGLSCPKQVLFLLSHLGKHGRLILSKLHRTRMQRGVQVGITCRTNKYSDAPIPLFRPFGLGSLGLRECNPQMCPPHTPSSTPLKR